MFFLASCDMSIPYANIPSSKKHLVIKPLPQPISNSESPFFILNFFPKIFIVQDQTVNNHHHCYSFVGHDLSYFFYLYSSQ